MKKRPFKLQNVLNYLRNLMDRPEIFLKSGKEKPLLRFHPWIFSGAIAEIKGNPADGDVVLVKDYSGRTLATGHYQNGSIKVRILSFSEAEINNLFWEASILRCWQHRKLMGMPSAETNIFRLVHAEGDSLPGLVVDIYGSTAVIQCHSAGMYSSRQEISRAIIDTSGGLVKHVYDKSVESLGVEESGNFIVGCETEEILRENGFRFLVDFQKGQKTGFFIDQRENRKLLSGYVKGKKVLNTFCYSGGFSVYAMHAGAEKVDSVDSSQKAIELTSQNIELNAQHNQHHEAIRADVTEWIKDNTRKYDIIILDPPAFAKHIDARHRAVQAYKRLNLSAMKQINRGGIIFSFSCSQVVDKELFRHTLTSAAIESGRKISILHQLSQGPDHPVSIFHPESEYLKGFVLLVE